LLQSREGKVGSTNEGNHEKKKDRRKETSQTSQECSKQSRQSCAGGEKKSSGSERRGKGVRGIDGCLGEKERKRKVTGKGQLTTNAKEGWLARQLEREKVGKVIPDAPRRTKAGRHLPKVRGKGNRRAESHQKPAGFGVTTNQEVALKKERLKSSPAVGGKKEKKLLQQENHGGESTEPSEHESEKGATTAGGTGWRIRGAGEWKKLGFKRQGRHVWAKESNDRPE